jgi:hypothetical protein
MLLISLIAGPALLDAQAPGDLTAVCVAAGADLEACATGEVAARALAGQMGLLSGWGSEVAGSASTLGRKIGNTPRLSFSLRAGGMSMGLPDLFDEGTGPAPEASFLVPALQGGLAFGVLDGFSPMSTVGGVLSLDLFGSLAVVMPPASEGFDGSTTGGSVGVRLGLIRESFTLPGVSVSLSRRFVGVVGVGNTEIGDRTAVDVEPSVTSLRVTLGKDLFGLGVLAGWGRDEIDSDAVLAVADSGGDVATVSGRTHAARNLLFGGLAMSFLLLQLSLEGGWAGGVADVPAGLVGRFDPAHGSPFGALSARFTP